MIAIRRLAYLALGVAYLQLIFGAIVRISGSGMGCGDNWPRCYGAWFPPMSQPTLVIEWTHRLLALVLIAVVLALLVAVWGRRGEEGVVGRGGVLRPAALAVVVVALTALFGAVTVKLGNPAWATVVHWTLAAALLATLAATAVRAGGLGAASAAVQEGSERAMRSAGIAAIGALLVIILGGLTAKIPGANVACQGFPLCRGGISPTLPAQHVQLTHRVLAYLLFFHVLGLTIGFGRRREAPVVVRTVRIALALLVLQVLVAASMVEMALPPVLRSLHQVVGVGIWITLFTLAYLARITAGRSALRHGPAASRSMSATTPAGVAP